VHYFTSLPAVYSVPKYAASLARIVAARGIHLHTRTSLATVDAAQRLATFDLLDQETGAPTGRKEEVEVWWRKINNSKNN
jgi:hypothetical protein